MLQALSDNPVLNLGALTPTRDFNFVADTISGMLAVLDNDAALGETINIGSGFEISIGDTVKLISDITGKKLETKTEDIRLRPAGSEVERLCCDHAKAKKLLGWQPKTTSIAGLRAGLTTSLEWFANPENRKHYHDIHRYTV